MPNYASHQTLAKHNHDTIEHLGAAGDAFSDWIATLAFYEALHIVEAAFYCCTQLKHGRSHKTRGAYLKEDRKFKNIYNHYRPLKAASEVARYLHETHGKQFCCFSDYLSPAKVRSELLNHRLKQLKASAARLVKKHGTQKSA